MGDLHDNDMPEAYPPGTTVLEKRTTNESSTVVLSPQPSDDPNEPLNWSPVRKAVNFGLTCFYVLFTFVLLDIANIAYRGYISELHLTYGILNDASAANFAGLATGCLLFIPFVYKYGRRPIYILSTMAQFPAAIWNACIKTGGELIAVNLLAGLGGAISETIVMITIVDLFFVHQHARMNGIFLFMQTLGTTGGPIAAGYIAVAQGWRWIWWWIAIFLGVQLLAVLFFFEESKYVPVVAGHGISVTAEQAEPGKNEVSSSQFIEHSGSRRPEPADRGPYPRKPLSKRLALITKTDISIRRHFYQPLVVLITFLAVSFAASTYGVLLALFSVMGGTGSYFMIGPPYNFSPSTIGLFHLGGFIGAALGTAIGGPLSDWLIVRLSRRNKGLFEPEMRLWLSVPGALITCAGLLIFGIGLSRGMPWIMLAAGTGIFGFGFIVTADTALTYLTDCYPHILGDALIAVVFIRNAISMIIKFSFTPWITGMGIQNTFVVCAALSLITMVTPVLLMIWGKKARIRTHEQYKKYSLRQPVSSA